MCYLTTIIWEFVAQRHVQHEREPSSKHPEGSTIIVWTAAQSTVSGNLFWHLTGTEVILWEDAEELHHLSFLLQFDPRYSSTSPTVWPEMCVASAEERTLGSFLSLSLNDIWIVVRVKQIKVQNLHSSHSEAVHIYKAPPYLWLGCFLGIRKFELVKTEKGTEHPTQFSTSWTRAVILERYQKRVRAHRCCLFFSNWIWGTLCVRGCQVCMWE